MCFGNRGTKTEIIYAVERIIIRVGGCEVVIFFPVKTLLEPRYINVFLYIL
jgi:hypothetical protein